MKTPAASHGQNLPPLEPDWPTVPGMTALELNSEMHKAEWIREMLKLERLIKEKKKP